MPMYEYECEICHVTSEHYVPASDRDAVVGCGACGSLKTRKVLSAPAPPRLGGVEGKLRTAEKIQRRNEAHFKSNAGQDEHRANVNAAHKRLGLP